MRYLITALDVAGAGLAASGLVLLAWSVHPFFALFTAGVCLIAVAFLLQHRGPE